MSTLPTARRGPVILISSVAALGGFLFGFDSGVINGTVAGLAHTFGTAAAGTGFAVASVLLGCAAGAFLAGTLADRFGRKAMLILTAFLFTLAGYGSGAAGSATQFICVRLVGGLAIGGASVLHPPTSPRSPRRRFVACLPRCNNWPSSWDCFSPS